MTVTNFLALDVGAARIGVAKANNIARIASPLAAVLNDEQCLPTLVRLIETEQISQVVVGWPRGLDGQETQQTQYVAHFIGQLKAAANVVVHQQDEAVTSVKAEAELKARSKHYTKADIDNLSAVYILEDFLAEGVH